MEKSEVKVSVVMPVLNTAAYIRECMESLVNQRLKEIEILCVDGGSTDGTREILEEYARRDDRVSLLEDTKGSTGYANNLGMETARGEYVAIVEPDDFVSPDMYEQLYLVAKENNADVVRADYQVFFGEGENREYIDKAIAAPGDYGKVLNPQKEQRFFKNDMSTWAGIYSRRLVREKNLRHNETPGAAYQDNGFWFLAMAHTERLYYSSVSGYRYRMDNPCSSVHNPGKQFAICDEYDFIAKRLKQEGIFDTFRSVYLRAKFIRYLSSYYRLDDGLKPGFADRFAREMQEHEREGWPERGDFPGGQQAILEDLLEDGAVFHRHVEKGKQAFHELTDSTGTLVQYGCGSDGFRLLNYMKRQNCLDRISCICDSNPLLWGKKIFGKPVCSLSEAQEKYQEADYIVASINYGDEIRGELIRHGTEQARIHVTNFC
jgi:glycosyltransferase involved in cell wall biosynthesis